MSKVPNRAHLVPAKKLVHGKTKTFTAIRYISTEEKKKRVKEFLGERQKSSVYTRHMEKTPLNVTILYPNELKKELPVAKNGEQYYQGHPEYKDTTRRVSAIVRDIVKVVEFKEPVNGCVALIVTNRPSVIRQFLTERIEKRRKVRFKRSKNVGEKLDSYRDRYKKLLESKDKGKKELGVVLYLLDRFQMRIGGSQYGVEEDKIKISELKPGMVISHADWKNKPQLVIKDKTTGGLLLRNMETDEDHKIPEKYDEFIRLGHYGATTLQSRHVKVEKGKSLIDVIGKSGKWQKFEVKDLSPVLSILKEGRQPTDPIFPSVKRKTVTDILDKYKIQPHDFRRYHATKLFTELIQKYPVPKTKKELKATEKAILEEISMKLWNSPGMAKSSYIDPTVYEAWRAGLLKTLEKKKVQKSLFVVSEIIGDSRVEILSLDEALGKIIRV